MDRDEKHTVKIIFLNGEKEALRNVTSFAFIPEAGYIGLDDENGKKYYYNMADISRFFIEPN